MPPDFQRLMAEATRLTRAGDLQAATAAIRNALAGASEPSARATRHAATPARDDPGVIDVEARLVDETPARTAPGTPSSGAPSPSRVPS